MVTARTEGKTQKLAKGDEGKRIKESYEKEAASADGGGGEGEKAAVRRAKFQELSDISFKQEKIGNINMLLDVSLPVAIELGRTTMRIKDVLNLVKGAVIELDKPAGEPVDLVVNSKVVAKGEVVVVDENFGLRITELMLPADQTNNL